ncbi:hypothetical protein BGZ61DRAFT_487315 [Ilyonectria robusta]|uniref:uncharacterized protein n=1 Tax=Ilyonectria robusta TaxID=1079257 RepID=UPI001E8E72CD|nr:uncharacterized protein BGZ61DRAFT_487315 [Ilyonectria robusta]KAH8653015.1 hypothetical protein BGZ61DRAFT_487315 [Ilyonectria robusta]
MPTKRSVRLPSAPGLVAMGVSSVFLRDGIPISLLDRAMNDVPLLGPAQRWDSSGSDPSTRIIGRLSVKNTGAVPSWTGGFWVRNSCWWMFPYALRNSVASYPAKT